jgi:hypothetical protein
VAGLGEAGRLGMAVAPALSMTLRSTPVALALLFLLALGAPAEARLPGWVRSTARSLEPDDPRWAKSLDDLPQTERHPVLGWVAGRIYIVRPREPRPGRKAELAFSPVAGNPALLTVSRRVLGTTESLDGVARLKTVTWNEKRGTKRDLLLLEVTYAAPTRGLSGALLGEAPPQSHLLRARYVVRASGAVLLGETTTPGEASAFQEKGLAQGIAYRRAGSLVGALSKRSPEEEARIEALRKQPVKTHCYVSEFSATAEENTGPRKETMGGVAFRFNPPEEVVPALRQEAPRHIFVLAHGWLNDTTASLEFASKLVRGILARAEEAGAKPGDLGFVFMSWNSNRTVFMESALCAETIGHRELAPLLRSLRVQVPKASLTLVGHSLGARMMLASLQGPKQAIGKLDRLRSKVFRAWGLPGWDALGSTFRRLLHIAMRGRQGPAAEVDTVVLLEAAIDVQTLHEGVGALNYGDTPDATRSVRILANCHSRNDEILRLGYTTSAGVVNTYSTIMSLLGEGHEGVQALGRVGAERAKRRRFSGLKLLGARIGLARLQRALALETATPLNAPGNRVVNVDVTAVMPKVGSPVKLGGTETFSKTDTHTLVAKPGIFDVIWQVTKLSEAGS